MLWGEADRIVDVDYGRAFAAAIPGETFEVLERAGHVPQVEAPEALVEALSGLLRFGWPAEGLDSL